VTKARYQSGQLQFGQGVNLFFWATRNGMAYNVTVTRTGEVSGTNGVRENPAPSVAN
jgi:hypothetical protein